MFGGIAVGSLLLFGLASSGAARPAEDARLGARHFAPRTTSSDKEEKSSQQKVSSSRSSSRGAWADKPYSNGKPAKRSLLDYRKCLKSNVLKHVGGASEGASEGRAASRSHLDTKMRIKSGAIARTRADKRSRLMRVRLNQQVMRGHPDQMSVGFRRKKGKLSQLNTTMLLKSGAMHRPNTIQVNKPRPSVGIRRTRRESVRDRIMERVRNRRRPFLRIRHRQKVGGRCFGHHCR
jgi:hypothetical protein